MKNLRKGDKIVRLPERTKEQQAKIHKMVREGWNYISKTEYRKRG